MTQVLEDQIRCKAIYDAQRCELHDGHTGKHQHTNTVWADDRCNSFLGTDRCVLTFGHDGGHQDGKGHRWESQRFDTHAVTIGDRIVPAWQETIRRAQQVAQIQTADNDTKAAEEKAAKDLLKSEMIGKLLELAGLPAGEPDGESRRLDDYVFSVNQDNYLRIWIDPPDADPEMKAAIYEDEWSYRDLSETWGSVYGDGRTPYALAFHEAARPAKLIDLQVWIADQFDRLEKNYADRIKHIEQRNKTRAERASKPEPTNEEQLLSFLRGLVRGMVDQELSNRGIEQ